MIAHLDQVTIQLMAGQEDVFLAYYFFWVNRKKLYPRITDNKQNLLLLHTKVLVHLRYNL
jgi:hypothetical protein